MGKVIPFKTKEERAQIAAQKAIRKRAEEYEWARKRLLEEAKKLDW